MSCKSWKSRVSNVESSLALKLIRIRPQPPNHPVPGPFHAVGETWVHLDISMKHVLTAMLSVTPPDQRNPIHT